jgi:hypothetical protein
MDDTDPTAEEEGDEYSDQIDDDNSDGGGIPKEVRVLRTVAYDKGVSDLVEAIHNKDLILDPDYQRNYVWDNKRASLLVESILLNVPIPVIYVAEDEEEKWLVVDGLQRLYSLRRYFDNEFKLSGLELLKELIGEQFSTLNAKAQRILRNGIIRVIVIKSESHPEIKYDIFQRLNRGSVRLNEQELRNCLYRGPLSTLLKQLCDYGPYLESLGQKKPHVRYNDAELALRFMALHSAYNPASGKVEGYLSKMKTFLNTFMEKNKKAAPAHLEQLSTVFRETIDKAIAIFPAPCFRRVIPDTGDLDSRTNRALMDAILISFASFPKEKLLLHADKIRELHLTKLRGDPGYNDSLIYGTSDTKRLELRISTWFRELSAILS